MINLSSWDNVIDENTKELFMKPELAKQGRPDDILKKAITQLTERNKELNCLYAISRISRTAGPAPG